MRDFAGALSLAVLAWLLTGCDRSTTPTSPVNRSLPPAVTAAAAGDKVLNIYNWTEFIDSSVVADFQQQYQIQVNYDVYASDEELETRLLVGHSNYDVVVPSASFFGRDLQAGLYHSLDKALLPNLVNIDAAAMRSLERFDPGNRFGIPYMWHATTGIGYDMDEIAARLPDAPTDSWRLLYDPAVLAHFKGCGISILDSPVDVFSTVFSYLGIDPNSESPEDLQAAEQVLQAIRPYVRYIDSSQYFARLANGDTCIALSWSGDVTTARGLARDAGKPRRLAYLIPREGTINFINLLAIPADAPHVRNAHLFLDFMMRPEVAARNSRKINYATPVLGAIELLPESLRDDAGVYPPRELLQRLAVMRPHARAYARLLNRAWTRVKFGH